MKKYLQPFKKYWIPTVLLAFLFIGLGIWYSYKWRNGINGQDKLWEVLDPVTALLTFLTTLAIFYVQAYNNWEKSLEKTLTISYFVTDTNPPQLILFIKEAYLSGESDIRQWAQSLGGQVLGQLQLDIAWDEHPPVIKKIGKEYFKTFEVELYLPTNPFNNKKFENERFSQFLERKFAHSTVTGNLNDLPIRWERNRNLHF